MYENIRPIYVYGYPETITGFIAALNGKYGVVSLDGEEIIPFEYDSIQGYVRGKIYHTEEDGKISVISRYIPTEFELFRYREAAEKSLPQLMKMIEENNKNEIMNE